MQTPRISKENSTWIGRIAAPLVAIAAVGSLGASCKKDAGTPKTDPKDVVAAADAAKNPGGTVAGADKSPLPGVDVSALEAGKQDLFYKMVNALPSPCAKAHSLRTSVTSDASCKRAPFAVRLVKELIVDEQTEDVVREIYEGRYVRNNKFVTIDLRDTPMAGSSDAPVTLVEFFDYGCPMCVQVAPALERVLAENQGKLKIYYKMFPLVGKHPDSLGAAQAVLAARAQGKFKEMHHLVFEKFGAQKKEDLRKYAAQLGLDLARYDADFAAAEAKVRADMQHGNDVGVDGTPTLFLNGRIYDGPVDPKYFSMAIDEEIAVRQGAGKPAEGTPTAPGPAAPAPADPAAPAAPAPAPAKPVAPAGG